MRHSVIAVAALIACSVATAESPIQQRADIAGEWVLEATAITLTGARNQEGFKWVFGDDGVLAITSVYKFSESLTGGGREKTIEDSYDIKEGKIVTGRNGTFEVVEKKPDAMTLKGPFGFYFVKKQ